MFTCNENALYQNPSTVSSDKSMTTVQKVNFEILRFTQDDKTKDDREGASACPELVEGVKGKYRNVGRTALAAL
jgi:hypothetical protein